MCTASLEAAALIAASLLIAAALETASTLETAFSGLESATGLIASFAALSKSSTGLETAALLIAAAFAALVTAALESSALLVATAFTALVTAFAALLIGTWLVRTLWTTAEMIVAWSERTVGTVFFAWFYGSSGGIVSRAVGPALAICTRSVNGTLDAWAWSARMSIA